MGNPQVQNDQSNPAANSGKKTKRTGLIIGAVAGLLVIIAAVVFVVIQSQANNQQAASNQGFTGLGGSDDSLNGQFGGVAGPDGGNGQFGGLAGRNFQMTPAKELPTTPADVTGFVTRIDNQSMFVSQRGGRGGFRSGQAGTPFPTPAGTPLPNEEVIFTADTVFYKDVTPRPNFQAGQATPSAPVVPQQVVQPGVLTDIATGFRVTVWGDKSGNQITAKVVVY